MSVEEYQLAWHDDESLGWVTLEILISVVQQLNELAWVRACRSICELALVIEGDTGLSSVGYDKSDFWLLGKCHVSLVLCVWVKGAADDVDTLKAVYGLSVETALEVYMVEAVLTIEPVYHTSFYRLYDNNATVEVGLLIHVPNNPVNECAEEVSLTELNDFLWHHAFRRCALV